ncbi:hypothetical protein GCM10022255_041490 [Dactylosporangium darangshiense]|uniref:Uncharacterized protein n=1 Tax=Dactylosporangium darangshiense TaxID=579108 RepID=A0ABP8D9Z4_9ACTN
MAAHRGTSSRAPAKTTAASQRGESAPDPDDSAEEDALAEHARRVVDRAPPLTQEQRARLAALLRPLPKRTN